VSNDTAAGTCCKCNTCRQVSEIRHVGAGVEFSTPRGRWGVFPTSGTGLAVKNSTPGGHAQLLPNVWQKLGPFAPLAASSPFFAASHTFLAVS
jgi:hypothetical protein